MNLPNSLTILRIIFVPFFILFVINNHFLLALIIFSLACLTDAFDGSLARRFDQGTRLGSILDPIADKLLLNSSFITFAFKGLLPWWLAIIILCRDILITVGGIVLYTRYKKIILSPTFIAKKTTLLLMLTITIVLLNVLFMNVFYKFLWVFIWFSTILTITSGLDYAYITYRRLSI